MMGWTVAEQSKSLNSEPISLTMGSESVVLFRPAPGVIAALEDRCCHRFYRLSKGQVCNGLIECGYHGWKFDKQGACKEVPSFLPGQSIPPHFRVRSFAATEREGLIWINLHHGAETEFPQLRLTCTCSSLIQTEVEETPATIGDRIDEYADRLWKPAGFQCDRQTPHFWLIRQARTRIVLSEIHTSPFGPTGTRIFVRHATDPASESESFRAICRIGTPSCSSTHASPVPQFKFPLTGFENC